MNFYYYVTDKLILNNNLYVVALRNKYLQKRDVQKIAQMSHFNHIQLGNSARRRSF